MNIILEIVLAFMCLFILYKAERRERMKYAIFFFLGLTSIAHAAAIAFGTDPVIAYSEAFQYWLIKGGVVTSFIGSLKA